MKNLTLAGSEHHCWNSTGYAADKSNPEADHAVFCKACRLIIEAGDSDGGPHPKYNCPKCNEPMYCVHELSSVQRTLIADHINYLKGNDYLKKHSTKKEVTT
jgi:uncharacterized paraquat-inducible protein A